VNPRTYLNCRDVAVEIWLYNILMTSSLTSLTQLEQVRRLVTAIPGPLSNQAIARRSEAVSGGLGLTFPVVIERASDAIMLDIDGNQIIDMGSGIGVVNVGNSTSRVVDRVIDQVQAFTHTCFTVAPYLNYIEVCEALNRLTPGTHKKKSMLANSGAEAVENAVKIARHYTKRQAIVVFEHAYHGRTNLTMALNAKNMPYKDGFGPFAPEIYRVPMPYSYRWIGPQETITEDAIELITHKIEKEIGAHNVAAILIEPIQGEGGFIVPPTGFLPALSAYCTEKGIVFIADEVQTGFARTGHMFAIEEEGVVPDLLITAKALGGGLPIAGVTGRAEIMDSSHMGGLGGTFGGNPLSCAAALGVLETIESEDLIGRARHIGDFFGEGLRRLAGKYPVIGEVRGRGAMLALELIKPGSTEPNAEAVAQVLKYCTAQGVLILSAGTYGNVIRFLPPLVITDDLLTDVLAVLDEAFATL
jgi:4-aminobutyrate aminotransferase/(S)-3-amino-2-methylpropionate transaminase